LSTDPNETVYLQAYDLQWLHAYQIEANRLQASLGKDLLGIEHIGSTAIPNMDAKPIVDIMLGIADLGDSEPIRQKLIKLGYHYFGEANVAGRLYFLLCAKHDYNLAVCQYQASIWQNNLLFRDFLRAHPEIASQYSQLKQKIVASGVQTLLEYSNHKQDFIENVLRQANN